MAEQPAAGQTAAPALPVEAPAAAPAIEEPAAPQPKAAKPKKGVRFVTTEEGEVLPERVPAVERASAATPRAKAAEALEWLIAGNARFRKGELERCKGGPDVIKETASDTPRPSTVIVSCSDSRVSPEVVLDQGLGDCHVVRVAGNVVNDFVMGTVLFAVQHLGCRLVLVLGHSHCTVVASAVQKWARAQSAGGSAAGGPPRELRSVAEGVQKAISAGALPPGAGTPTASHAVAPSPFEAEAWRVPAERRKPGLFSRLCCSGRTAEADDGPAPSPPKPQGDKRAPADRRSSSNDRSHSRGAIARTSLNPLSALANAIGSAVEAVANSGQHGAGLKSLVHKEEAERDRGYDSDDQELKKGLKKQDSLEFNRARLARQREERKIETLRQLARREDVDSVIDENTKVSAATIIRGLVKNLDEAIARDLEVVAAKYTIESGSLRILGRNWFADGEHHSAAS